MIEMTQVWERLFIGGHDDAQRLSQFNPKGITTVISLFEISVVRRNTEINYLHLPIDDAKSISVGQFDSIIDALFENIRWGTVLLHCGSGMSRAPIMAAAWMHVVGYQKIDAALEKIAGMRPIIAPSSILLASVKECL
jgi:protein-tyrosine phosphatase